MPVILSKNYELSVSNVDGEVYDRLRAGNTDSFIYIAPTKRKLRSLQREFLRHVPGCVAPAFHLYTLETLAVRLHSLLCPPKRFVSGPVQAVLINEALQSCAVSLGYFRLRGRAHKLPRGTFQKIIDVINTLKEKGVYRASLYAEIESTDIEERDKLQDVLSIYNAYEMLLGDRFIDTAGMLKEVNERWVEVDAATLFRPHFGNVNVIVVAGFDEFSDPELTMLYNCSTIERLAMLVSFDYHLNNDEVFGHLKENYMKFLEMGFQKITTLDDGNAFVEHVTKHLFRYEAEAPKMKCRETVTLLDASTREEEVELIAKLIKKLALDNPDRDLSKICVAMHQPQIYTSLFREVFERFGIPANITDRYYLDQSPLVVSTLALLSIHQNNFRVLDMIRALSSPYFRFTTDTGSIDAGNLYEVSSRLKISAGQTAWLNRIEQRLATLREEIHDEDDEIQVDQLRREEHMLLKARSDVQALARLLHRFDGLMTPVQFKEKLLSLLDEVHVVEGILQAQSSLAGTEHLERDTRAYQKFLNFLDEFLEILEFDENHQVVERLPFYVERVKTAVSQARYNIRQKYGYGVSVTSFDETRGLRFDVMIIAGLVDGEFPPTYKPEILFSPSRRAQKERYHLNEHRYLLYQALTNFTEHLYLTVPRSDAEVDLVPSSFLEALVRIVDLEDCRGTKPEWVTSGIFSEDELLRHVGKTIGQALDQNQPLAEVVLPDVKKDLHEMFDHIHHAIVVERSRMHADPIATYGLVEEYNGKILDRVSADARKALEGFRNRVYSITQLESYGKCPFQFFSNKVLRLTSVNELEEGMSPLERGGILHEILFEFYTRRREKNLPPMSECTDQEFQMSVDELIALANRKLEALNIPDVFWDVDKELVLGSSTRKGLLREFLDAEREASFIVKPAYFEVAFGSRVGSKKTTDVQLTTEHPLRAGDVQLRGKVDRIDIGDDTFKIIDYKTGSTLARREEIDLGMSLQLPMYLYAVEHLLATQLGRALSGGAGVYYKLTSPVKECLGIGTMEQRKKVFTARSNNKELVANDQELRDIIDRATRYVNEYVDNIARGKFPVEPKKPEQVCTHCDYKTICRIQTRISAIHR
ncbi:MAG: exodeoxyribonuclease V subunit gamma [Ignavibacteria bacterium]|nr:exodeoxyribonuclease V subunit gamma [Ignavibacteria bacterium]MBI3765860.1 exodeoxyribonuclease V subunit gamma [Ignavibacteriales bacterium]